MTGSIGTNMKYLYWSERKISAIEQDNGIDLGSRTTSSFGTPGFAGIPTVGWSIGPRRATRHSRALSIERALSGQVVSALVNPPGVRFISGTGAITFSHFQHVETPDQVVMFAEAPTAAKDPAAICLFGSMSNFPEFLADVEPLHRSGWVSSSAPAIEAFLKDRVFPEWVAAADARTHMAVEALKVADGQGITGDGNDPKTFDPYNRGFTFGGFEEAASWFAEIYLDVDLSAEGIPPEDGYSRIIVGSPIWVRTPRLSDFRVYEEGRPGGEVGQVAPKRRSPFVSWFQRLLGGA
jgi:hypothetical protein